jgi:ABC-type transporter Mla subunit MlaD
LRSPALHEESERILNEFELQAEYTTANIQEATFQLANSNDKIKLDLKKIGLIINELSKKSNEVNKLPNNNYVASENSFPSSHTEASPYMSKLIN